MKKKVLLFSTVCLLAGSLMYTGCKKDEDTTGPEITLTGDSEVKSVLNQSYSDAGATAKDDKDGDVQVSADVSAVNKDMAGTYTVTYTASDKSGNTSTATRTVKVYNQADVLNGTYGVTEVCSGATSPNYTETITASNTINGRIHFAKFANYVNNTTIYADIVGNTINIPSQTAIAVGNPAATRQFSSNSGSQITSSGLIINYTEVTNGTSTSCSGTYTKQ